MSLTDERKKIEKNKNDLKAARTAINNKLVELGGVASTSFNDIPEKTTELANTITATNKTYIDSKTGDLSSLQTQDKNNLVNAINEIKTGKANTTHKHNASDITQDANNRFVTDTEKNKWNNKIDKSTKHQIKLLASNWVGSSAPYSYAITIQGMDTNKNWEVTNSVEPLMTSTELDAFGRAKIVCGTQTTNTVNLIAYGKKPTTDINLLINVRGD